MPTDINKHYPAREETDVIEQFTAELADILYEQIINITE